MRLQDFDFSLPAELIAQHPAPNRSASRLLHVHDLRLDDRRVRDLPALLLPGDLLIFNDTRVMKARLSGHKDSGGKIEMLVERVIDAHHALAQVKASHAPKTGARIVVGDAVLSVRGREGEFFRLELGGPLSFWDLLEHHGQVPLPPYIDREPDAQDASRYQTIYAREPGAVAAPTAGLHFDDGLIAELRCGGIEMAFITLHVGAGTFKPVRVENLDEHRMHTERYEVPQPVVEAIGRVRKAGGKVVAVGTTTLRALESAALEAGLTPGVRDTALFIRPGFRFRVVDRLLTNFHLPKSTLLMLVSAFAGYDTIRAAYLHAVAQRYRFFSYGDAMLLDLKR